MLPAGESYREVHNAFRWEVPEFYNIAVDVCDRRASGSPTGSASPSSTRAARHGTTPSVTSATSRTGSSTC